MASRNEELLDCILNGGVPTGEPKSRMEAYLKEICEMGGVGGGGGKNCRIIDIVAVDGGNQVTFAWTNDDGTQRTRTMFVANGEKGEKGDKGETGEDGFSPNITENVDNTADVYKLDIETKDGTFTTPNLKGASGTAENVTSETFVVTGEIDYENQTVTINQTFAEITEAQVDGKTIQANFDIKTGEDEKPIYCFDVLYITSEEIMFNWINGTASLELQISLKADNTTAMIMTNLNNENNNADTAQLIVTGEYSADTENWTVSNISKTYAEIDKALNNNQDVILKLYPAGTTENPYFLRPAMHYVGMGVAFSVMVPDTDQISGLSVMIMKDDTVMASNSQYEFENESNIDDTTTGTETTWSSDKINSMLNDGTISIVENGEAVKAKITKGASITEYTPYVDRNGKTGYSVDELYFAYDSEQLARGIENWIAEHGITLEKSSSYTDLTDIYLYSSSASGAAYMNTKIVTDGTAYISYQATYNGTDYVLFAVQYNYETGKVYETSFNGLNVFNIAKLIPDLAGCYIQEDILELFHNWFYLHKATGLEGSVNVPAPNNVNNKTQALLSNDELVSVGNGSAVGSFDLGNMVALMTSPLQKLLFTVDKDGTNLKAYANKETNRTSPLSSGLFGSNLLAPKNIFTPLDDMSTLPTPPTEALGIYTISPVAVGQPENITTGGTLIVAHITNMLYSQTVNYIGTRVAIYLTPNALYYKLGTGGKYYPTAAWQDTWRKIASTAV